MKAPFLLVLVFFSFLSPGFAGPPPSVHGRKLTELKVIPTRVLQRSISPWFYRSVLVSPLEGWVTVRAELSGSKLYGERIVRSDLDGAYDALALKLTKELRILGDVRIGSQVRFTSVLLDLFIYRIADGTMALSCTHLDTAGDNQLDYFGCAKLLVLKDDGQWTEIKGPEGLQDKGLALMPPVAVDIANARLLFHGL